MNLVSAKTEQRFSNHLYVCFSAFPTKSITKVKIHFQRVKTGRLPRARTINIIFLPISVGINHFERHVWFVYTRLDVAGQTLLETSRLIAFECIKTTNVPVVAHTLSIECLCLRPDSLISTGAKLDRTMNSASNVWIDYKRSFYSLHNVSIKIKKSYFYRTMNITNK